MEEKEKEQRIICFLVRLIRKERSEYVEDKRRKERVYRNIYKRIKNVK